jgi:hypothetical protein
MQAELPSLSTDAPHLERSRKLRLANAQDKQSRKPGNINRHEQERGDGDAEDKSNRDCCSKQQCRSRRAALVDGDYPARHQPTTRHGEKNSRRHQECGIDRTDCREQRNEKNDLLPAIAEDR